MEPDEVLLPVRGTAPVVAASLALAAAALLVTPWGVIVAVALVLNALAIVGTQGHRLSARGVRPYGWWRTVPWSDVDDVAQSSRSRATGRVELHRRHGFVRTVRLPQTDDADTRIVREAWSRWRVA